MVAGFARDMPPQNFSALRKFALALLRRDETYILKETLNKSIAYL
jgi:hypothetical protein